MPTSVAHVLDRADLALALVTPWLGLLAVVVVRPQDAGLVGATGWLPLVLYTWLTVGTFRPREGGWLAWLSPFLGPAPLLVGQLATGQSGALDRAVEASICGVCARGLAIGWLLVRELSRGDWEDLQVAGPGTAILLAMSAPTVWVFLRTWQDLHGEVADLAVIVAALALSLRADVLRFDTLREDFEEPADMTLAIVGMVAGWMAVSWVAAAVAG